MDNNALDHLIQDTANASLFDTSYYFSADDKEEQHFQKTAVDDLYNQLKVRLRTLNNAKKSIESEKYHLIQRDNDDDYVESDFYIDIDNLNLLTSDFLAEKPDLPEPQLRAIMKNFHGTCYECFRILYYKMKENPDFEKEKSKV